MVMMLVRLGTGRADAHDAGLRFFCAVKVGQADAGDAGDRGS